MACQETVTLSLQLQLTRVSEPVKLLLHVTKVSDFVYFQPDCWKIHFSVTHIPKPGYDTKFVKVV